VPRFDLTDVSVNITLSTDATTGLSSIRYSGNAAGTDYLSGTLDTVVFNGVNAESPGGGWTDGNSMVFRNNADGLLWVARTTTVIVPVPEPGAFLAIGAAGFAILRRLGGLLTQTSPHTQAGTGRGPATSGRRRTR
jgi:hypothetical protein